MKYLPLLFLMMCASSAMAQENCITIDGKCTKVDTSMPMPFNATPIPPLNPPALPMVLPESKNSAAVNAPVIPMINAPVVQAGPIYKYMDNNGQWVYTDSLPKGKKGEKVNFN